MASYSNLSDGLDANGADKEWQVCNKIELFALGRIMSFFFR